MGSGDTILGFRGHHTDLQHSDTLLHSTAGYDRRPCRSRPLTQTHRVRSRVPYEGKCVASIEVGPTARFNRSAQLNLAFCNKYRRWDLNPHPVARTGF